MISLLNVICSFAVCLEHHPFLSPFQHFNSLGILKNKNSTFSCGGPSPNQSPWWPGPPALTSRHFAHWGNLLPLPFLSRLIHPYTLVYVSALDFLNVTLESGCRIYQSWIFGLLYLVPNTIWALGYLLSLRKLAKTNGTHSHILP